MCSHLNPPGPPSAAVHLTCAARSPPSEAGSIGHQLSSMYTSFVALVTGPTMIGTRGVAAAAAAPPTTPGSAAAASSTAIPIGRVIGPRNADHHLFEPIAAPSASARSS